MFGIQFLPSAVLLFPKRPNRPRSCSDLAARLVQISLKKCVAIGWTRLKGGRFWRLVQAAAMRRSGFECPYGSQAGQAS